jgi:hypothetical protein
MYLCFTWTILLILFLIIYHDYHFVLFLVEKSLAGINCLFACLLVCPQFTDWSKNNVKTKGITFHKTRPKVIEGEESESEVSFFQYLFFNHFFIKKFFFRFFLKNLTKGNWGWGIWIRGQFFSVSIFL